MHIAAAQLDVRRIYRGGFVGQLVSGGIWLLAAAVATWISPTASMAALFLGGTLIFPITTVVLSAAGGPAGLPKGHPFAALAMQIAFTVPLGMIVAIVVGLTEPALFFPASMIVVGAHYLPFVFLYGMRLFAVLAGVLVIGGVACLSVWPAGAAASGWFTGVVLVAFAFALRASAARLNPNAPTRG
ncbi:hypothetical protein D6T64_18730 [Cryobacterium melibiosiphilum]|uniref:Uncharacterized protein n=1 Tax=Cryobacterium melibiosiphilum TaxID=995039 RepID=A0A3A5MKG7_9MICO|nr:hypothetical protein [Cryobacterium melibiosiphilum]RJT85650.1 hypothetical protein D6T64_18730 [Cryobacterium melibiosiphilum]